MNNGPVIVAIKLTKLLSQNYTLRSELNFFVGSSIISPAGVIYLLWIISPNSESIIDPKKPHKIMPKVK